MHAGTLAHAVDRLANSGRVLYIAAHPDDENTRLLAYLANQRHVTAAYLSMTRGGGGQNLIGSEQDELLDVIRTEELLAARRLDAATQRFTRMRDFGYSKSAAETLAIWEHDEALADVVWVIRSFQPDVIIARFDELPPNHGHHTASAILAREAYVAAADPQRFPEQLSRGVEPWHAERLLLNVPTWREGPPPADALALDVGAYDVRLGLGYGELAARSRSQHKSQGFGVPGERGAIIERFVSLAGTRPTKDILDDVDLGWTRFGKAAAPLVEALVDARASLERDHPERALPALLKAQQALDDLPNVPRVRDARLAVNELIAAVSGLFVRATAARPGAVPGSIVPVKVELVLRRDVPITLRRVLFPGGAGRDLDSKLGANEKKEVTAEVPIPADAPVSAPYWLAEPPLRGRQQVADLNLVGEPTGPPALTVDVELGVGDRVVHLQTPVLYAWTDSVQGERVRRFLIVPPATLTPARRAVMFPNRRKVTVALRVRAAVDELQGIVRLPVPGGWRVEPPQLAVSLPRAGDESSVHFEVTPAADGDATEIRPVIDVTGRAWGYREDVIDYPHIPLQVVLRPSTLRLVPLALRLPKGRVGYIPGSGDSVAEDLAHVGVAVEVLDDETIRNGDLDRYAAIVVGIRAFNTRDVLRGAHERLMKYVVRGGTLVVQYNTNNRLAPLDLPIGPYPLTIGRDRITDETAKMELVNSEASVLRTPNRIADADFDGWVQERGLYYAEKWDDHYVPIFKAADPDEAPLLGGLLVAPYGRGTFIYTGLSFFRQLPAGVPGAYRLFANLIAGRQR